VRPRPTSKMILPGGREIRLETPRLEEIDQGRIKATMLVAVKQGSHQALERRGSNYAKKVLRAQGFIVGSIRSVASFQTPGPFGPIPYAQGRWAPVRVVAWVRLRGA